VVDTHKPSLVIEERLLSKIDHVVVIDHHRRGEEFIKNPLLVYMEPYASSTAELVTELLEYQPKKGRIEMLEATALLAGIIVDTKSFTLRTGARTFDAASYLRGQGADTVLVQKFLKEDVDTYVKRAKLIETVSLYREGLAIAKGNPDQSFDQVLIAQTADTLLTMDGIDASFVISKRADNLVGISARSLGDVNVQIIMESLEGGGHLTNAATQLTDITVDEAEERLHQAIDDYFEGRRKE
jgi:cyclic-di-AMP phosphodiesterase